MNRKTAHGRDCAAPSSSASAANRVGTTESLFAAAINRLLQQNLAASGHSPWRAVRPLSADFVAEVGEFSCEVPASVF
jgi:hypothetical protein